MTKDPELNLSSASLELGRGRVIREFSERVLSHNIARASVLVISPHLQLSHGSEPREREGLPVVAEVAKREGHDLHCLSPEEHLDEYWAKLGHERGHWTLLAYVDAGGREGRALANSQNFLENSTVTYLVLRFDPTASIAANARATDAVKQLLDRNFKCQV